MSHLVAPVDATKPLFVYGLLQPGELAHSVVEGYLARRCCATARGALWLRDGLPLFDLGGHEEVQGHLLWFDGTQDGWNAVRSFEPASQYKWSLVAVAMEGGEHGVANVLCGKKLHTGTAGECVAEWSARLDPVFVEGIDEVRCLVLDTAPEGVDVQPDRPELWRQFFRLQATYLLLWSIVERYTALRFGPALDPGERVGLLGEDASFLAAVVGSGAQPDVVVDSRNPDKKLPLRPDGSGAAKYFYQVRSNLSHRGKGAFQDSRLVLKALVELHDTMRLLLAQQLPAVADAWRVPAGDDDCLLLRGVLASVGCRTG